ncbi:hypothetical protein ENSA7_75200 [Enhygromyxa salina]|uniref:Uncharacterized protein n=1 Tax=Enhygromyxa salina TaxID=215803 RepID=A0A2S9XQS3_9BACT|nr:hypothetical protein ENSA7_75200 [Enhygromyxa salina]
MIAYTEYGLRRYPIRGRAALASIVAPTLDA